MKTLAIVQARMASTRLPGKVMKIIGHKSAIGWTIDAARRAPGVDGVVVATSTNRENDTIETWCHLMGVHCYRGSEDDVLDRYCSLIREYRPVDVVRLTADCPFLDSHVIGSMVALHQSTGSSYTTNQWPPTWPDGLDVEVISAKALLEAGKLATSLTDRDTVTQYIWRNQSRWPASTLSCPLPGLEKERWVLDSPEDFELLKLIAGNFNEDWVPNYMDIWHYLNNNPEYRSINTQWSRNQRFYEAIVTDEQPEQDFINTKRQLYRAMKVIPCASQTYSKSCRSYPRESSPLFATHGDGAYLFDVDGNRFVDLVGALLPNILGYNDPDVNWAIRQQLDKGISLSLATEIEAELAELLVELIPCAEMVRFGKNGSDATSGAVRLARAHTARDRIGIVAVGEGYHGWHDWAIANTPRDGGVPGLVKSLTKRINPKIADIQEELCRHRYAAIIIDPENHSHSFLSSLKEECSRTGALLIFDEIRTGFRYALGGYQQVVGVIPDLACFGKSMGNGMPISAIAGPKNIMNGLDEASGPFWSGTFFGETLSLAAALATIKKVKKEGVIEYLINMGYRLIAEVKNMPERGVTISGHGARPLLTFYHEAGRMEFMKRMIAEGILIINSNNLCYAMGENELKIIINAYRKSLT